MIRFFLLIFLLYLPFLNASERYLAYVVKDFKPYFYVNALGKVEGFSVEVLDEIARTQGFEIEYVAVENWKEMWKNIHAGNVDLVPSFGMTEDRKAYMLFSTVYETLENGVYYDSSRPKVTSLKELCGLRLGINATIAIRKKLEEMHCFETRMYNSFEESHLAFLKNEVDLVAVPQNFTKSFMQLTRSQEHFKNYLPVQKIERGIGVKKEYPALLEKINAGLGSMLSQGRIKEIRSKWFPKEIQQDSNQFSEAEKRWIQSQTRPLRLGIDPNWMPVDAWNPITKEYSGMASDYFKLISEKTGLRFEIVPTKSWPETRQKIEQGEVDVVSVVMESPELSKYLAFTQEYLRFPVALFTHRDETFINSLKNLSGKRIAMVKNSKIFEFINREEKGIFIVEVENINEGLELLHNEQVYGFLENLITVGYVIQEKHYDDVRAALTNEYQYRLQIGLNKNFPPEALSVFKKALNQITKEQKDSILYKWYQPQPRHAHYYQTLIEIAAILLAIVLLFAFWNYSLRRENKKRLLVEQELKKVNAMLASQNEQLDLSLHGGGLGTWDWDITTGNIAINDRWAEMLGFTKEEVDISADTFDQWIHPDDWPEVQKQIEAHFSGQTSFFRVEMRFKTRMDGWHWISGAGKIVQHDKEGKPLRMTGVNLDIHQEKEFRIQVENQERYINRILHSALNGVYVYDVSQGKNTFVNPQYTALLGYTLHDLDDFTPEKFFALFHPEDQETIIAHMEKIMHSAEGEVCQIKYRFKHKNGQWIWLLSSDTVLSRNELGIAESFMGSFIDITEDTQNNIQLQNALSALEQSNEDLQHFAFAASHDLQEPLRTISGHLQLIESRYKDKLDEKGQSFIRFAVDGAQRMQNLIQGLLQFSRVQTHGQEFANISLEEIMQQALNNLDRTIKERHAEITSTPLPVVQADMSQITQVFDNLLSNAIKFCPDKVPEIHISAHEKNSMYEICIEDNGVGFNIKYQDKVFTIFKRLHKRADFAGEGIGMALCKRIIERHGGEIYATSNEGEGSRFCFTLPKAKIIEDENSYQKEQNDV